VGRAGARTVGRPMKPMTIRLLIVVAAVAAIAYLLGSRSGEGHDTPAQSTPSAPAQSAPTQTARQAPQPGGEAAFWGLVDDTRAEAGNDTGRQSGLLEQRLSQLPPQQIVDYQRIRHRLDERAYTWDLWGAAFVIEDGCSDDCFRDFRSYLISLGRGPYEAAIRDPDSLAPIVQDAEEGDWENADSVAGDAYESATGEDIPVDDSDLSGNPRGQPWDDDDEEALLRRYPRLAERFR
jgi:Protein of unknown function (DUF4240)